MVDKGPCSDVVRLVTVFDDCRYGDAGMEIISSDLGICDGGGSNSNGLLLRR